MSRKILFYVTLFLVSVTSVLRGDPPDTLWSRFYGGGQSNVYASSLVQTADGGFAMAGYIWADWSHKNFWLVRTDEDGQQLWEYRYNTNEEAMASSLVQTADGGFAMAGYIKEYIDSDDEKFLLVRTDEDGQELWAHEYNEHYDNWEKANSLVQTADGGFAMAGTGNRYTGGGLDFKLVRTDENGQRLWDYRYETDDITTASSLVQTADGGFAMAGCIQDHINSDDGNFRLVRTDEDGQELWAQNYEFPGHEEANSLVQTADGGFAMAGYGYIDRNDFLLVRTDEDGQELWTQNYGFPGQEKANSLVQTADGGFAMVGMRTRNGQHYLPLYDAWLIRLASENQGVTDQDGLPLGFAVLSAYPNPVNSSANISFVLPYSGKVNLIVYDSNGREVESMLGELFPAGNHRIFFDASQLLSGIYFAKLNVNGRNHVQKLVLIK